MAYPNEILVGRFNAILHKLFDMKEGAPAPQLTGEIVPTICLENDRPEYSFLGGNTLAMAGASVAAVAGEYIEVVLFNPAASNMLSVIEQIHVNAVAAAQVGLRRYTAVPANPTSVVRMFRDLRKGVGHQPVCGFTYHTEAALTGTRFFLTQLPAATTSPGITLQNVNVILPPGIGFGVSIETVNVAARVNFFWRERVLEPSETR